jgi:copper homeostasis protein CutC
MIRPVSGGFDYPDWALDMMRADILKAGEAGATGVVFGILDQNG